jgi:hypothetical protein
MACARCGGFLVSEEWGGVSSTMSVISGSGKCDVCDV